MTTPEIRLYAHRGASLQCAENSLEAFKMALEDGANALELDVHSTSDNRFVVTHDADGRRMAGDCRRIKTVTLDEVKKWRLPAGESIPTLDEVLEAFNGTPMSIDLKPRDPSLVPAFLKALQKRGAESWVTVASFHHSVLSEVRRLNWGGRTALSRLEVGWLRLLPEALAGRMIQGHSAQIPLAAGLLRFDGSAFLERCRRLGLRTDYWVVNDPDVADRLLQRGATGLMSDDPGRIAPVVAAHETTRKS